MSALTNAFTNTYINTLLRQVFKMAAFHEKKKRKNIRGMASVSWFSHHSVWLWSLHRGSIPRMTKLARGWHQTCSVRPLCAHDTAVFMMDILLPKKEHIKFSPSTMSCDCSLRTAGTGFSSRWAMKSVSQSAAGRFNDVGHPDACSLILVFLFLFLQMLKWSCDIRAIRLLQGSVLFSEGRKVVDSVLFSVDDRSECRSDVL